jgi:hypothetical protein
VHQKGAKCAREEAAVFDTVLVANRGEIACRVIKTLRRLGIRSVAVFSLADADAPHVRRADVAVRIESYLAIPAVIDAARATGAQAARVLSTVNTELKTDAERDAFEAPILAEYERQGSPYYSTARLWDDGVIDPLDTRRVLAMGISAALNAPIEATRFGVFRM